MARQLAFALAVGLSLGGCSHDIAAHDPSLSARAEFGRVLRPHHAKRVKLRHVIKAQMPVEEITSRTDEPLDPAEDELSKKLVICRGCEEPAPSNPANALWPKSTVIHLTVDQVSTLFPTQKLSPPQPMSGGRQR